MPRLKPVRVVFSARRAARGQRYFCQFDGHPRRMEAAAGEGAVRHYRWLSDPRPRAGS